MHASLAEPLHDLHLPITHADFSGHPASRCPWHIVLQHGERSHLIAVQHLVKCILLPHMAARAIMLQVPQASPAALDLISRLCQWDPSRRPTALEALQHPFFQVHCLAGHAGHG